jgi:hypothetical protein
MPVPEWATAPFETFIEYVKQESILVHLATRGIAQIERGVPLAEALAAVKTGEKGAETESVRLARELADLAKGEIETEFTRLHGHSIVGVWGGLESLVEDVVVAWLKNRPSLLLNESFRRVKVSVGEFQASTRDARLRYLVGETDRRLGISAGLPRFEQLFEAVGLGGPLDEKLRRKLIEMYAVRNVVAHRRGIADRKLRTECPWRRDWRLGRPVKIGHEAWSEYMSATQTYGVELIRRTGAHFGIDIGNPT